MADTNEATGQAPPVTPSQILLTKDGYTALQQELEHLTMVKRPEIAQRIRESQEHGEFSEDNSELDEVKFEQAIVESRIAELKALFGTAQVLESKVIPTEHIGIGSLVKLHDKEFNDEFEVRIVTSVEANPSKNLVSNESPMGTVLMGKKIGESVVVEAPDGSKTFKVSGIRK